MKFVCPRCGKKYATSEEPAPGRSYRLKCKACGHVIVVRNGEAVLPPSSQGEGPLPTPTPPPLGGAPAPTPPPIAAGPGDTTEVSMPPQDAGGDPGYVELFADGSEGSQEPTEDPLAAAARASLPDAYGGAPGAPDPFAAFRDDLARPPAAHEPAAPDRTPPTPKIPVIPKPPAQKRGMTLALIGGGVLVMIGILAVTLLSSGKAPRPGPVASAPVRAPAPAPAAAPAPPPPAPAAQPAPPAPAAAPAVADATPAPVPARSREEQRRRDREAAAREKQDRAQRERDAREAKQREKSERERDAREAASQREQLARAAAERDQHTQREMAQAAAADDSEALSPQQVEKVLASTRRAFEACIQNAKKGDVKLDGRRVSLRLNIQASGIVTYPTLDDVTLNGTELGQCLKNAARLMVFPKFRGDPMQVEVPLVLQPAK